MIKKSKMIFVCCIIFTASFFLTGLIMSLNNGAHAENDAALLAGDGADEKNVQISEIYVLKDYNGLVGVFYKETESEGPIMQTEIDVNGLRAVDRELVEKGIEVSSYEAVLKLIEDFSS